jgi:hypothetical protein
VFFHLSTERGDCHIQLFGSFGSIISGRRQGLFDSRGFAFDAVLGKIVFLHLSPQRSRAYPHRFRCNLAIPVIARKQLEQRFLFRVANREFEQTVIVKLTVGRRVIDVSLKEIAAKNYDHIANEARKYKAAINNAEL